MCLAAGSSSSSACSRAEAACCLSASLRAPTFWETLRWRVSLLLMAIPWGANLLKSRPAGRTWLPAVQDRQAAS